MHARVIGRSRFVAEAKPRSAESCSPIQRSLAKLCRGNIRMDDVNEPLQSVHTRQGSCKSTGIRKAQKKLGTLMPWMKDVISFYDEEIHTNSHKKLDTMML